MFMRVATMFFYFWFGLDFRNQNQCHIELEVAMMIQQSRDYKNLEKTDYRLQKAEFHLEFLARCRENYVIPRF